LTPVLHCTMTSTTQNTWLPTALHITAEQHTHPAAG
jgi:hypothetical protein